MELIIVLGAQNDAQGRLSPMALARAQGALEAYRRRTGSKLVVTGGYGHFNPAPLPHARYMAAHLIEQGVDPDDILARVESAHTVEDAALTRPLVDAFAPPSPVVVVTSAVHVPRARLIFEHFYDPARLVYVGTPDAVSPQRLQELHAHELHGIEFYQGKPIVYSLGNFWIDGFDRFSWMGREGIVLRLVLQRNEPLTLELVPIYLDDRGVPQPDASARAVAILTEQSREFGTTVVPEDGRFRIAAPG